MKRLLAMLGMAMPVFGQYAGPAILSRGEAPAAMNGPEISFRPFVDVSGVYSTGLSGVTADSQGNIANQFSAGLEVAAGISGSHHWRHTVLGLSYRGDYNHYFRTSGLDTTDHSLLLGITHQLTRHITLSWSNSAGIINRDYGLLGTLSQVVPFDPSQAYVPNTDFFNNRTIWLSSSANMVYQKSSRLSFSFGGGLFTDLRASKALYNVFGIGATGDVQYRITRQATLGVDYNYQYFLYGQLISNSDVHSASATFAYRMSRWWEFSGYAGAGRVESKFIQSVPVDPVIASIIGISESTEVVYSVRYIPSYGGRLSRTFQKGVFSAFVSHGITPGNGLFLTSSATNLSLGYTYTGLRRWGLGVSASDQISKSIGNVYGGYGNVSVNGSASRQISHNFDIVAGFSMYRYTSSDFIKYNQLVYSAHLGIGWSRRHTPAYLVAYRHTASNRTENRRMSQRPIRL